MTAPGPTNPAELTELQLHDLLAALLGGWQNDHGLGQLFGSTSPAATVATVHSLVAHAYRLASCVHTLLRTGFGVETVPLIRAAYEATLTAAWVAQIPDGVPAYMNYNRAQQRALMETIIAAKWVPTGTRIAAHEIEDFEVTDLSARSAKVTLKLCADFVMNHNLYGMYRGLCASTHPTAHITDLYIDLDRTTVRANLRTTPKHQVDAMRSDLYILCASLVWAERALDSLDADSTVAQGRTRLTEIADRLQVPHTLIATPEAVQRGAGMVWSEVHERSEG